MLVKNISQNFSYKPTFGSSVYEELQEEIPNQKCSRGLTYLDTSALKTYFTAKPYRMGITREEIQNLEKSDGHQFILDSYEFLTKKMGIPIEVRPALNIVECISGDSCMGYLPNNNLILCDSAKLQGTSKKNIFALIRHELQHFLQNAAVFRHETLGKKAIDKIVSDFVKQQKAIVTELSNNYTDVQVRELYAGQPQYYQVFKYLEQLLRSGDESTFNIAVSGEYKEQLCAWQTNLIKHFGLIPKGSSQTSKIETYFNNLSDAGYFDQNLEINFAKYLSSLVEKEALAAESAADLDYEQPDCPIKYIKDTQLEFAKNNEAFYEKLDKQREKLNNN